MASRVDTGALCNLNQVKEWLGLKNTDVDKDHLLEDLINRTTVNIEVYCDRHFKSADYSEFYNGNGYNKLFIRWTPIITVKRLAIGRNSTIKVTNTSKYTTAFIRVTSTGLVLTKDGVENATITFVLNPTLLDVAAAINLLGSGWTASLPTACLSIQSSELLESHNKNCINSNDIYLDISNVPEDSYEVANNYIYRSVKFPIGVNNVRIDYTAGFLTVPKSIVEACAETVAFLSKQSGKGGFLGLTTRPDGPAGNVSFITMLNGFLPQVRDVLDQNSKRSA